MHVCVLQRVPLATKSCHTACRCPLEHTEYLVCEGITGAIDAAQSVANGVLRGSEYVALNTAKGVLSGARSILNGVSKMPRLN